MEQGRGAALAGHGSARARRQSRDRPRDPGQERPLRPVRDRGGRRRREAADGVALQVDVAGDGDARGRAPAARAPARRRCRPGTTTRRSSRERPLRPVREDAARTRARSPSEEQLLTITLDETLALLAQPKQRGRNATAQAPLRELGRRSGEQEAARGEERPLRPVRHRRRDEREPSVERRRRDADLERAVELMAARRERGPSKPKSRADRRSRSREQFANRCHCRGARISDTSKSRKPGKAVVRYRGDSPPVARSGRSVRGVGGKSKNPLIPLEIRGKMPYGAKAWGAGDERA